MRTALMLLALLALAMPLQGLTTGPKHATPHAFSVHDLDRDGYLNREEYAALRAQCQERSREEGRSGCALVDFDVLDANHDGRIGEDELVKTLRWRYRGGRKQ